MLWLIAPLVLIGALLSSLHASDPIGTHPSWYAPEASDGTRERSVGLQVSWNAATSLVAPEWSGVVQRIDVTAGDTLESGDDVALIGGVQRFAYSTAIPFTRALQLDDSGADVTALNSMLSALGRQAGTGDTFTARTLAGIQQLAAALQVPQGDTIESFDPGWVVYIPAPQVTVATVDLQIGVPAPPAGTAIAATTQTVSAATLVSPDTAAAASSSEEDEPNALTTATPQPASDDEILQISTTALALNDERTAVAPQELATLQQLLEPGATFTLGSLISPIPAGEVRVAASSIIAEGDTSCVITGSDFDSDGEPGQRTAVPVTVTASGDGNAWVTGDLTPADRVLEQPRGEARSCLE